MLLILKIIFLIAIHRIHSVQIEYPPSEHIQERRRTDFDSIDRIFRYYLVPHEIQYHVDALKDCSSYFLRCTGTKGKINFTVPSTASDYLSLNTDYTAGTITATLRRKQLRSELVGRYSCSETISDKVYEEIVHVFIQDGKSVFTKRLYPKVLPQTGIHFFNLPCQTNNWYAKMTCPSSTDNPNCKVRECSTRERQMDELKCNLPLCENTEPCIPVFYMPNDLKPTKAFFDPQIGFALENPIISSSVSEFTCMSSYTPSQSSRVPYDSYDPDFLQIHQPSLTVLPDETVRLSCEIQYGTKVDRKIPTLFWFEDIHKLVLVANETEKAAFNPQTQIYSRNSSIILRGFKPKMSYQFYCVRVSDQGIYSRSIEINCADLPTLDLEVTSAGSETAEKVSYGSDSTYDISIFTIPRSKILLELFRGGISLRNDKRFVLTPIADQENQFFEYTLTIFNMTFEDETDIEIRAKSSVMESKKIIRPIVVGNPVGQISFALGDSSSINNWRNEEFNSRLNIYALGILEKQSYRVVCSIRHRADINQPLNVFIQRAECSVESCLSDVIDRTCRSRANTQLSTNPAIHINKFQTEFVSVDSYTIDDYNVGNQYLCCYEKDGEVILAKALTALARHHSMFNIEKPEFSLVTGDVLTYQCEAHQLIYDDLKFIYNDGLFTYQRNRFEGEWRIVGTNQVKQVDIDWFSPTSETFQDTVVKITTPSLKKIGKNGFLQCIALSKRPDFISNMNDTYMIHVDDPVPLRFKNNLISPIRIDRKAGANVEFDCIHDGRPKPKVIWYKGKLPWTIDESTYQIRENNGSIFITRAQASDTGFYTCEIYNRRDPNLRRSFDLRVKGSNLSSKFRRYTLIFVFISALIILLLIILLIIVAIKYFRMRKIVEKSLFHAQHPTEPEDKSKPLMTQLMRLPLPDNFASTDQIKMLLSYANGDTLPAAKDDFKELGHGQYGVVYQVRLPEVGLVAAKLLPESIRSQDKTNDKKKKREKSPESQELVEKNFEDQKKKAAEMLIDELKVMNKAGKHVNIVSLLRVAYPETKFKYLFKGGLIRDEDSFYLMELCSNGSLESMLKRFLQSSTNNATTKPSLYETLTKQAYSSTGLANAEEICQLTPDDLTLIAYQVASGVDYLNRKQIAHCDIAARNVLVNSRFIMKICDFGLATWTTYKNYREQLERHESVQLEKKNNELATHNLTPELARAFLRASTPDERLLLNKSSIKSDVWSFGIFLWTLFLKCRLRPFNKLSEEMQTRSKGESFFHRLARVVSDGHVLHYIDYQPEIPRQIYAIIRECLSDEERRPEMTRIRTLLCHSTMLSKNAFQYYGLEYNRYQEENASDENVLRFGEVQGESDLPSFKEDYSVASDRTTSGYRSNDPDVTFRPKNPNEYYLSGSDGTSYTVVSEPTQDNVPGRNDSYLEPTGPRTIAGNISARSIPIEIQTTKPAATTGTTNIRGPTRPAPPPPPPKPKPKPTNVSDSYV